jgi:hypothetical protein
MAAVENDFVLVFGFGPFGLASSARRLQSYPKSKGFEL